MFLTLVQKHCTENFPFCGKRKTSFRINQSDLLPIILTLLWIANIYKKKIKNHINCAFVGIDPSKWDSVFESFEQADLSTTRL